MASNLPQSGLELVVKNAASFLSTMSKAEQAGDSFSSGMGKVAAKVGSGFSSLQQIAIGALREIGSMLVNVLADAGRALGSWLVKSVGVAGDFEQTLNVLGATSGATAQELDAVAQKAKDLGSDLTLPATSALDAADVMLELSKAGFSVQQSMDAAKGALQLAAAAETDAATAASIVAGAINAFGLEASEAVRIADLLAGGANASSASMTDLSQGLQQAGFAFNAVGMPVEDLVTSLAALTNVGLTGSDAGTALKNALQRLMNPTEKASKLMASLGFNAYDATGKMKSMPQIISDLNLAFAGMTDEQKNAALGTIFLSDGMKAMIPLLDIGEDGFLSLKESVTAQGAAADVAAAKMKGWNGAIEGAQSQLETLQLIVGTFIKDALAPLAWWVADTLSTLADFADRFFTLTSAVLGTTEPLRNFLGILMILSPSLVGIATVLLKLYDILAPVVTALSDGAVSTNDLSVALMTVLGPLGATRDATMIASDALLQIWDAVQRVAATLSGAFVGAVGEGQGVLTLLINTVLTTVLPTLAKLASWLADTLPGAIAVLDDWIHNTAIPAIQAIGTWIGTNLPPAIKTAQAAFASIAAFIGQIMPVITSIISTAIQLIAAIWEEYHDEIELITRGVWEAIQGVIKVILGVIQGVLAIFLAAVTGDWQKQMETIRSANATIWEGIASFFKGILNIIAGFFGTSLDGIAKTWSDNFTMLQTIAVRLMELINQAIRNALITIGNGFVSALASIGLDWDKAFRSLQSTAESLMKAVNTTITPILDAISGGFDGIADAISRVIKKIKDLIKAAAEIVVPDLVTPGSPTPLEIGFRGIDRAVAQAARTFESDFAPALGSIPALQVPSGASSGTTTNSRTYHMPIYTNQSPAVLTQSLALIEATTL